MPLDASLPHGLPDACYALLHEVRLRGIVEGGERDVVGALLAAGLVAPYRTAIRVTARGRALHAAWARLAPASDAEQVARRVYERFGRLNHELLRICHDWQVRAESVPNDHLDARYDWTVVGRLGALDERARPLVGRLVRVAARFDRYPPLLRSARERVEAGQHDWLASPRVDSYHTVWMQLHEDLLCALGITREDVGDAEDREPDHGRR